MPAIVALLRGQRAGAVLLVLLLALSVGVPAVAALSAQDGGAGDGPSIGVLSTAAFSGLHRLLLSDAPVRLTAPLPAALLVDSSATRPAGEASATHERAPCAASPHAPAPPLRI